MEFDSLGLLFIGLSLMFLIAVLFGHQRREHMSTQNSAWDNIRYELETELEKHYDFDIAKFRSSVIEQNKFFDGAENQLQKMQSIIGVPLTKPLPAEVKNTEKLFDEKIRLLRDEHKEYKSKGNVLAESRTKLALTSLTSLAKIYMFNVSGASKFKAKSGLSTISNIIG